MSYRFVDSFRAAAGSGWNCSSILSLNLSDFHLDNSPRENLEFCEENMLGFEVNRNFRYLEELHKQFFVLM
jgi:hypothetical protein